MGEADAPCLGAWLPPSCRNATETAGVKPKCPHGLERADRSLPVWKEWTQGVRGSPGKGEVLGGGTLGTAVLPPGADGSAAGPVFELLSAALTPGARLSILSPVSLQDSCSGPPRCILDFPPS